MMWPICLIHQNILLKVHFSKVWLSKGFDFCSFFNKIAEIFKKKTYLQMHK